MTFSEFIHIIKTEYKLAKGFRLKSIIVLFRLANFYYRGKTFARYLLLPFVVFYKVYVEFIFGVELPAITQVGIGLRIFHGVGLVVHRKVIIGENCILRHCVTIGNKGEDAKADLVPTIGDNVEFGANTVVIGKISIGDNVIIGAGTVVTKDIPANSVVVAPSFRIFDKRNKT